MSDKPDSDDLIAALRSARQRNEPVSSAFYEAVYAEVRKLASRQMARESGHHTLQATDLAHEAYLRLIGTDIEWQDRAHFFAVVATTMRRVLVDHARNKGRAKRGAGAVRVTLSAAPSTAAPQVEVLDLDHALTALARLDQEQAHLVELYYFAGLTLEELGSVTGLSVSAAHRALRSARAWIGRRLKDELAIAVAQ